MAIRFVIAGEVVSLRAADAASCSPQQILPLIPSSSMRSLPLIDFGDPTSSGGTPCDPSALLPAPHQLSRLEQISITSGFGLVIQLMRPDDCRSLSRSTAR